MKITKLHIENFRGFRGTHEIEFSDSNIHAIVGVNGAGKTSILDALAIVLADIAVKITGDNEFISLEQRNYINIQSTFAKLTCHLYHNYEASMGYHIYEGSDEVFEYDNTIPFATDLEGSEILPILLYYRSGRAFHQGIINLIDLNTPVHMLYHNAFNTHTDFSEIFRWYLKQINIQNNEKVERKDLDYELPSLSAVTKGIDNFLSVLRDDSLNVNIAVSKYNNEQVLVINKSNERVEFHQLSSGEKMVIGMVLDIAYRMSIANPHFENPLISEGIVLIDELEQHLHPKWQMSILKALTETFPNVQFIVTTHSPLVINQLENDQLSILDNFKITSGKEVHKVYGRDVNAIIEDFMGASDRPLDVKALMSDVEKLLDEDHPNIERARQKLNELKAIIDPNDYDVIKLETQIVMEEDDEAY